MKIEIVILAAGKGTRMRSQRPKVLHAIGGQSMLAHVVATARTLQPSRIHVVYGHGGDQVREQFSDAADADITWVNQSPQRGTGDAVRKAMVNVAGDSLVLILYGDVPLIQAATLDRLIRAAKQCALAVLTVTLDDPQSYGRILRSGTGHIAGIVEYQDASEAQRRICEINTGFIAAKAGALDGWLARLTPHNAQGEYYLTDVVGLAVDDGVVVGDQRASDRYEVLGVNTKKDLAQLERRHQKLQAEHLMDSGVTLIDPARFDLRGTLTAGEDCEIDINVVIFGDVVLGERVKIGPNVVIKDSRIGDDSVIEANSIIDSATVQANCSVGPFARLRPGAHLEDNVRIGNFVEVKNSRLSQGAKANHLAYVGDSQVGKHANIGAGVITCNYDGANKHQTVIGDHAFIGSNSALVAPLTIGDGATIGAGSTISRPAPAEQLTLTRVRQQSFTGWQRPKKTKPS